MSEDGKILELLKSQPEQGMGLLIEKYMGLCYYIVKSRLEGFGMEDVEECINDIFVEIYRNIEKIDLNRGTLKAFLSIIARRKAAKRYQALHSHQELPLEETVTQKGDTFLTMETRSVLLESIKKLGEPDSRIFMLKYYFGYSTKMIAAYFQLNENTVDKKVQRGLEKIKVFLREGAFYE